MILGSDDGRLGVGKWSRDEGVLLTKYHLHLETILEML